MTLTLTLTLTLALPLTLTPKDMKFGEVPQGVRVLGGTYAVDGDEVCLSLPVGLSYYTPETP